MKKPYSLQENIFRVAMNKETRIFLDTASESARRKNPVDRKSTEANREDGKTTSVESTARSKAKERKPKDDKGLSLVLEGDRLIIKEESVGSNFYSE